MISETNKKKKLKKNNYKYQNWSGTEIFFCQNQQKFFSFSLFSDVYRRGTSPPPITHCHGLKEIPPREGESHPSLNRWLAVPIPTVGSVTHGQGCRSGGDPRPRLPPGVAVPTGKCRLQRHRLSVVAVWVAEISVILVVLLGCCEKLIWVGVGYFWWEVMIKK